jgi:hypothetical protein
MGTGSAEKPTDAITALLQERRRYEQWLATLESRRAITPPHVYARVHADYEARLSGVLDQLGGRSAELQQSVDSLTARVAALQADENAKRDERYEAELRAAVGEYSPERWTEVSESTDAEINRLTAQRTEATAELAQVQQLLHMASTRRPEPLPPATLPPLVPPPPATVPRSAPPSFNAPAFAAPTPSAPAPSAPAGDLVLPVDELVAPPPLPPPPSPLASPGGRGPGPRPAEPKTADGALRKPAPPAVAPPAHPATAPPAATAAAAPAKPEKAEGGGSMFDELEFLKSVVGPRPDAKEPAKAAAPAAPRRLSTPPEASELNDMALRDHRNDPPRKSQTTDSVPVFLRDVPTEQAKTLKCQECGSMNYPTEWYCERCGGELAAM